MDQIRQTILGARMAQSQRIQKGITAPADEKPEEQLKKGDDIEDPERFLKATEAEEIEKQQEQEETEEKKDDTAEKSDIANALSGYGAKIPINKTGKEIKDQITNIILPDLTAKLAAKETEATNILESCGGAPTHDVPCWWTDEIKLDTGYKMYEWRETDWCERNDRFNMPTFSVQDAEAKKQNLPESKEQAMAREKYNEIVRAICNIKVDIKTCEVMNANLKDSATFELTPKQVIVLRF